jgi:hypothetical protein
MGVVKIGKHAMARDADAFKKLSGHQRHCTSADTHV